MQKARRPGWGPGRPAVAIVEINTADAITFAGSRSTMAHSAMPALAEQINARPDQAHAAVSITAGHEVECGRALLEAMAREAHGKWLPSTADTVVLAHGLALVMYRSLLAVRPRVRL